MTTALDTAPAPLFEPSAGDARAEGGRTLAERLDEVLHGVHVRGAARCPLCDGVVERAGTGGACRDCGTQMR